MSADKESSHKNILLIKAASLASVLVALFLVGVKTWVWLFTGSLSVLASLVDSLLDVAASLINMLAIRYSLKSADREHPFGHGKAESLAGLGQAIFIACSALFVIVQAFKRFTNPQPLQSTSLGIGIMIFAVVVTVCLVAFQSIVVKRTGSMAIKADSLHYSADLFTNLGTVTALLLARYGWPGLDPWIAMIIALVVFYNAWQIAYGSTQLLMDRHLSPETEEKISWIAMGHKEVVGIHDIRTRRSGQTRIIQLHLEMLGNMLLQESHRVAKEVEAEIRAAVPDADIIIHQDPVSHNEESIN
jgi:ferrous-iron efflux pump FieF